MSLETFQQQLSNYGQDHLVRFWSSLSNEERKSLSTELEQMDFAELTDIFERATKTTEKISEKIDDDLKPIPATHYESVENMSKEKVELYENIGFQEISNGKVGVLLLAGGQATRLGFEYPKGMYDVGLPSHKTLFQLQAERILRLQEMAGRVNSKDGKITWYIMTSEHTMAPTADFFKKHKFFGLCEEDIVFFEQGHLPCYDFNGKILLDKKHHIASAPDGNGGIYKSLRTQGILDHMSKRGVEHLHAHSVDNILIKVADPVFIGYCKDKNADCASKVVKKSMPDEALGVVCVVNGKYKVVEYSELPQEAAERRNPNGDLTFNAGNICNHYFSADFLKKISCFETKLKLHVAKKKIPYIDDNGVRQKPEKPNGIKVEKFIFDVFELAQNFVCLEVPRDVEFSALKNNEAVKENCPSTVRKDLLTLHNKYIKEAGGIIEDGVYIEISPLLSYSGEGLDYLKGRVFNETKHLTHQLESNGNGVNGRH